MGAREEGTGWPGVGEACGQWGPGAQTRLVLGDRGEQSRTGAALFAHLEVSCPPPDRTDVPVSTLPTEQPFISSTALCPRHLLPPGFFHLLLLALPTVGSLAPGHTCSPRCPPPLSHPGAWVPSEEEDGVRDPGPGLLLLSHSGAPTAHVPSPTSHSHPLTPTSAA